MDKFIRVVGLLFKQTKEMHVLYIFILHFFCTTLHVSNDHFVHHQESMIYCILQLYTNHTNVSKCRWQLDTFVWFVQSCRIQ